MHVQSFTIPVCATCCDPCALGTTLNLLLAGITICTGCFAYPSGTDSVALSNVTGLNAAHVLTGGSTGPWSLAPVGSVDWVHYGTADCTGAPVASGTTDFSLAIACLDGVLTPVAQFSYTTPGGTFNLVAFYAADSPLDTATANETTGCGLVLGVGPGGIVGGTGGTSTISQ